MTSVPKITEEQKAEIWEFIENSHAGQKRKTISVIDGKQHEYHIHLQEVARRSKKLIFDLIGLECFPEEEQELLDAHPEIIDIIAWGHDLIEDCLTKNCGEHCPDFAEGEFCHRVIGELRNKLIDVGISDFLADTITDSIRLLTNDHHCTKARQAERLYKNLREAPLFIKIIKLADEWHNLATLFGKDFISALKNYIKIRKSWPIIFNEKELIMLYEKGILEDPYSMRKNTVETEKTYKNIRWAKEINDLSWYADIKDRLKFYLGQWTLPLLPNIGEYQIFSALEYEKITEVIDRVFYRGLKEQKKIVKEAKEIDLQIRAGARNIETEFSRTIEDATVFLKSIGILADQFLQVDSCEEFETLMIQALEEISETKKESRKYVDITNRLQASSLLKSFQNNKMFERYVSRNVLDPLSGEYQLLFKMIQSAKTEEEKRNLYCMFDAIENGKDPRDFFDKSEIKMAKVA